MPENKESIVRLEEAGTLHIAEDVVASIAALAASEVEGVAQLAIGTGVADLISKKSLSRGVKITLDAQKVNVDVYIITAYGYSITTVASKVQDKVKKAIETMSGLEAGTVNVHVGGISFEKQPAGK